MPSLRGPASKPTLLIATILLSITNFSLAANNDSLIWGPYRPNLYFGIRPRQPESLATGLLWSRVDDLQKVQENFRYTCEQTDKMAGYGWEEYDARNGGRQEIHDAGNLIDLTTEFVKVPGGQHGGNWGARIRGKPRRNAPPDHPTTIVFSIIFERRQALNRLTEFNPAGYDGDIKFQGQTDELGWFTLDVTRGPESNSYPTSDHPQSSLKPGDRTHLTTLNIETEHLWQTKSIMFELMRSEVESTVKKYGNENLPPAWQLFTLANTDFEGSNFNLVQKTFKGSFEFDVLFTSNSAPETMTSERLTEAIKGAAKDFDTHHKKLLKPGPPFDKPQYEPFSKALLSNLMGGIGYFYGDSVVDKSYAEEYEEENEGFWTEAAEARARIKPSTEGPHSLFTAVPSRPFFPRGFLWDEGFHLLPIVDWDTELVVDILTSWFNLMDEDGWIAREQILGDEAASKVPPEFQVQYPHYANPPTLFLVFESLLDKMDSKALSDDERKYFETALNNLYPLLKRHYGWFRKTQKGDLKTFDRKASSPREAYRWRGRSETHLLTSGLDDYPRPKPPHPGELHVDLMSWMGMMTRVMRRIAGVIGDDDDVSEFDGNLRGITQNLVDLHWSEEEQAFCDASVNDFEENTLVCHKGYVSLLPLVTGLIDNDNARVGATLDLIHDRETLWSDHGVRSLSKKDEAYGTGENYWRSPVWMNINYLVLRSLLDLARSKTSPHAKRAAGIYTELRRNLVETVYESWKKTGFAWEQYNPDTGEGQRTQHFTGWTSLAVTMMRMPDLSSGKAPPEHGEL